MPSPRLTALLPEVVSHPSEARNIEYKRALTWGEAKSHMARVALSLANTRDGGFIVIGVNDDGALTPTGLTAEQLQGFNADDVTAVLSSYGSESMELRFDIITEVVLAQEMKFVVVEVSQFRNKPIFARKDSPDGKVKKGILYVRPYGGKPESKPATAEDHDEILQIGFELRLRAYVETTARAGLEVAVAPATPAPTELYATELGGL